MKTYKISRLIAVEQQRMRTFLYLQQKVNICSDSLSKIKLTYFLKIIKFNYISQIKKSSYAVKIHLFKIVFKPLKNCSLNVRIRESKYKKQKDTEVYCKIRYKDDTNHNMQDSTFRMFTLWVYAYKDKYRSMHVYIHIKFMYINKIHMDVHTHILLNNIKDIGIHTYIYSYINVHALMMEKIRAVFILILITIMKLTKILINDLHYTNND
jgi:hypothetical protein